MLKSPSSFITRNASAIVASPAATAATALCIATLDSSTALAYFPVFWIGFTAAIEFLRGQDGRRGPLMDKIAFWVLFPAGVGLLAISFALTSNNTSS